MDQFRCKMIPAYEVSEGDSLDLEGDEYADTDIDNHHALGCEFAVVEEVEQETNDCVVITTSYGTFGFPTNHLLKVKI